MATTPSTNINIPYSAFLDPTTGRPSQEWLLWLINPSFISINISGALPVASGGTGLSTIPTNGQLLIGNGTGYTLATLTPGSGIGVSNSAGSITVSNTGVVSFSGGSTGLTPASATTGAVSLAGTLGAGFGGTGIASYAIGDIIYASGTTALAKLADVATGNALISGGVTTAPSWGKIGLTTHVSGTLPIANGGTNSTATPTAGAIAYGTGSAIAYTAAGTTGQVLTSATAGTPTWSTPASGTVTAVSVVSANGLAGSSSGGATPALTLSTTITGLLKGNGTAISAASSGADYAPATSGTSILYGNGAGGFSNVAIGSGVAFSGGTLSATGSGGTVTSVTGTAPVVSSGGATPAISMAAATTSVNGYLTSADWTTFNNKQPAGSYLVNGGALGTPSSGTVTNLTGTASININGTVGATTPAAGKFTTLQTSGNAGIGTAPATQAGLYVNGSITGATAAYGILQSGQVQSDVTNVAYGYLSQLNTQATAFTLNNARYFTATQGTIGAGSSVTTQVGFYVDNNLTGATSTNIGFQGNLASGTGRYNLYMAGTAANYLGGATTFNAAITYGGVTLTNSVTGTGKMVLDTSPTLVTPALGTPTSGTVTNLTGTASININGTVGATTANTGAFTTLSATGLTDLSAAGAGQIKFPATQNASANANTLDDYKEGTWTPTDNSGASLSFTIQSATYTKIGRFVSAAQFTSYPATASGATANIAGLPFANGATYQCSACRVGFGTALLWVVGNGATSGGIETPAAIGATNLQLSNYSIITTLNYQV